MALVGPELLPFDFPTEVQAGQLIQVSCAVTMGDDPLTIQWYKDDQPLVTSANFFVNNMDSRLSVLLLRSVNSEHSGIYRCLALNPVGQASYDSELRVKGYLISHYFFLSLLFNIFLWYVRF